MHAEITHFIGRGIPQDEACHLVGLRRHEFYGLFGSRESIKYLPTPEEIRRECERIRNGDIVLSERSGERWREFRELKESSDQWELDGRIKDDACEVPAWWRPGGDANA